MKVPGEKGGPVGSIAGEVVYEGKPFQGVQLVAFSGARRSNRVVTDAQGGFTPSELQAGTWEVHGRDDSHLLKARAAVKSGETTQLRAEAEPAGTIILRIKGATKSVACDLTTDDHYLSVFEETTTLEGLPLVDRS